MSRAIILAAGRGSRMGDHTKEKPKCLSILANNTLLNWQLTALRESGISDITVVKGYKSELIKGDFDSIVNANWSTTNMVASLFTVSRGKEDTIISYSDIVYHPQHVRELMMCEHDIVITADLKWRQLWELRFKDPLSDAETFEFEGDRLINIGEKAANIDEIQAQFMGLIKLSSDGWSKMYQKFLSFSDDMRATMDMTKMINLLIKDGISVHIVFVEGGWCESDTYEDITKYEEQLYKDNNWPHDWRRKI